MNSTQISLLPETQNGQKIYKAENTASESHNMEVSSIFSLNQHSRPMNVISCTSERAGLTFILRKAIVYMYSRYS